MLQINLATGRERPVRCISNEKKTSEPSVPKQWDADAPTHTVYSLLRCRVCLGNPYLIEGNLLKADAMHDMCWCQNPTDSIDSTAEPWSVAKGHDAFYVRGLA